MDVLERLQARTTDPPLTSPLGMLAELTHRCPLGCPYCSNPLALEPREDELGTDMWARVFREAAALGVLQVHLSGGEPAARRDLVEIAAAAHAAGLYTNLITSAVGLTADTLARLHEAGLDHVQVSIQDSEPASADRIAGYRGGYERKRKLAAEVVRLVHNEAQGGFVLLAPERVFKADAIAAEILKRCTGEATLAEIVDELASAYAAPRERVLADMTALLRGLVEKRLLEL